MTRPDAPSGGGPACRTARLGLMTARRAEPDA